MYDDNAEEHLKIFTASTRGGFWQKLRSYDSHNEMIKDKKRRAII